MAERGVLLAALVALGMMAAPARELAVTVDDLPWAHYTQDQAADMEAGTALLLEALAAGGVTAVGFVNPDQLEHPGFGAERGRAMLRAWLDGGHALGNHTWGHLDLHAVGATAFKAGILAAELELRPLLEAQGQRLHWFRHPYLRTGKDLEERASVATFLTQRGYRIAPVSIDNSDWIYALAYRRLLAEGATDAERAAFRSAYVSYLIDKLHYYEAQALALLGEPLPQVLLLHAQRLNAEALPELLRRIEETGWRFVTLEQALQHPAYRRPDAYRGRFGPGWIHRWALAEGKPRDFFGEEPRVPAEVMVLAGVESE